MEDNFNKTSIDDGKVIESSQLNDFGGHESCEFLSKDSFNLQGESSGVINQPFELKDETYSYNENYAKKEEFFFTDVNSESEKSDQASLGSENPLESLDGLGIDVVSIQFEGLKRTRDDFIAPMLKSSLMCKTFGNLTQSLSDLSARLTNLDIFKGPGRFIVDILEEDVDTKPSDVRVYNLNNKKNPRTSDSLNKVAVRVEVEEKRLRLQAGTEILSTTGEIGFGGGIIIFNVFGRGERAESRVSFGSQSTTPFLLSLRKPIYGGDSWIEAVASTSNLQGSPMWSYSNTGASLAYSFPMLFSRKNYPLSFKMSNVIKYSCDWRNVSLGHQSIGRIDRVRRAADILFGGNDDSERAQKSEKISSIMRREAGYSLRSAIGYTMQICTRDDNLLPRTGSLFRLNAEICGLGGTVYNAKGEVILSHHLRITPGLTLSGTIRGGHIASLVSGESIPIVDRFQVGGPLSIRGFRPHTIGPRDSLGNTLGGDTRIESGLQLSMPVFPFCNPFSSISTESPFALGHVFLNAGVLLNRSQLPCFRGEKIHSSSIEMRDFFSSNTCVSMGAGLLIRMSQAARLEVNFAYPLIVPQGVSSSVSRGGGLQIGLGVEFL